MFLLVFHLSINFAHLYSFEPQIAPESLKLLKTYLDLKKL